MLDMNNAVARLDERGCTALQAEPSIDVDGHDSRVSRVLDALKGPGRCS
jgi:hypothetical protein